MQLHPLTDQEQRVIQAEEIYRDEVRRKLSAIEPIKSRSKRVLVFLNTALGIWLLSTVVVGVLTWSYAQLQENAKKTEVIRESTRKLHTEIVGRLDASSALIEGVQAQLVNNTGWRSRASLFSDVAHELDGRSPIYEEFSKRSLRSLLVELQQLVSAQERSEIKLSLIELNAIRKESESGVGRGLIGKGPDSLEEVKNAEKDIADIQAAVRTLRLQRLHI
jgi:hypothetical protein